MGHDTVQTEDMKQQVELLQSENSRLGIDSEFLFKKNVITTISSTNKCS